MRGPLRGLVIAAGLLVLVVGGGLLAVTLLLPPARVKALVEAQASRASGYAVRMSDARAGVGGRGSASASRSFPPRRRTAASRSGRRGWSCVSRSSRS